MKTALLLAALLAVALPGPAVAQEHAHTGHGRVEHPKPRANASAARILPDSELPEDAEVRETFKWARRIPAILDGLYCYCDCKHGINGYSLLSCFEDIGMAMGCPICKEQTQLAYQLHQQGKTLEEIRSAVDTRFGR